MDWNNEVAAIVEPVVETLVSTYMDKMDVDGRDAYLEDRRREQSLSGCVEALEQSFNPAAATVSSSGKRWLKISRNHSLIGSRTTETTDVDLHA